MNNYIICFPFPSFIYVLYDVVRINSWALFSLFVFPNRGVDYNNIVHIL